MADVDELDGAPLAGSEESDTHVVGVAEPEPVAEHVADPEPAAEAGHPTADAHTNARRRNMAKAREARKRKKGGSKISVHKKKNAAKIKVIAAELGCQPHPQVVRHEVKMRERPTDSPGKSPRRKKRRAYEHMRQDLSKSIAQISLLEGQNERLSKTNERQAKTIKAQAKKIERLETTIKQLRDNIKISNKIIGDLAAKAETSWRGTVELYLSMSQDESVRASDSYATMHSGLVKRIETSIKELEKERQRMEKQSERWKSDLDKLKEQLDSAKDNVHDEKSKRRELLSAQAERHKWIVEDLNCRIVDLEIMLDKEKKLKNSARQEKRDAWKSAQHHRHVAESRFGKWQEQKLSKEEFHEALRSQIALNRNQKAVMDKMKEQLVSKMEKKELEKTFIRDLLRWNHQTPDSVSGFTGERSGR